ncbi:MAG: ATPase domain-containing protein [Gammaproteobacteria bacterium]
MIELPQLITSGIPGLDKVLGGGLRPGRLYFVEGDSGTGKTTLGMQFVMEGVRQGQSSVYVSLAETITEIKTLAGSHGWVLDGVRLLDIFAGEGIESTYTLFHPGEVELGERVGTIMQELEALPPGRLVVDTLSALRVLSAEPGHFRKYIKMLQESLVQRGWTGLMLDEPAGQEFLHPRSLAWGLIKLEQHVGDYGPEHRRLCITKLRGQPYAGGYHDFRIRTGSIEVYPRLSGSEGLPRFDLERISSGLPELDKLLGGGIARGTSVAIIGPPGTGKSTLATHYALQASRRGRRTIIYAFDEAPSTFQHRAAGQGMALDEAMASGHIVLRNVEPAGLTSGEFAHEISERVQQDGVELIVIDSMNGYLQAMPDERFINLHLHDLLAFLSGRGVVTLCTLAMRGAFGGFSKFPVDLTYIADTVILQRFFEAFGELRYALSVVKKRDGDHERTIREYRIGSSGLQLGEPLQDFVGLLSGGPSYVGTPGALLRAKHDEFAKR